MLSNEDLKPHYAKATFLFVTRNFKDDAKDREAARTHDRFGVTSWPQLLLFDPRDDSVLAWLPRDLKGFVAGFDAHAAKVPKANGAGRDAADKLARAIAEYEGGHRRAGRKLAEQVAADEDPAGIWLHARELVREWTNVERSPGAALADPDVRQRAIALEFIRDLQPQQRKPWLDEARGRMLDDAEHLVVRLRALRVFAQDPMAIAAHGEVLLAVDNDPFRFEVLEALRKMPAPALTPTFLELFRDAGTKVKSGNPNVLRIRLARCLGVSGDHRAVDSLAEWARAADVRNGLTGTVIDALASIGERHQGKTRQTILAELRNSFPPALEDANLDGFGEERATRMLLALCKRLRTALDQIATGVPPQPAAWSRRDRAALMDDLKALRVQR